MASTASVSSPMAAVLVVVVAYASLVAVVIVGGHLGDFIFEKYYVFERKRKNCQKNCN